MVAVYGVCASEKARVLYPIGANLVLVRRFFLRNNAFTIEVGRQARVY